MNLAEQRRYALVYLRWFRRHQRRAYRLVRQWLSAVLGNVLTTLEQVGVADASLHLNSMVPLASIQTLLRAIYQHTLPEAARNEFDRLSARVVRPVSLEAGFFSRQWQQTTARMLGSAETASRISQITETTRGQIRRILQQANVERLDVRATARRIRDALGGKGAARRALLIARTETTRAANAGHEAGAASSGLKLDKLWIATADARTRETHRAMIGKPPIGRDEYFVVSGVRMRYPGDPAGGPAQVCNCRCTVAYVPAGGIR